MNSYQYIIMISILLLTACQTKQSHWESGTTDLKQVPTELYALQESNTEKSSDVKEVSEDIIVSREELSVDSLSANDFLPIADVPVITESEASFEGYPKQIDFESIAVLAVETIYKEEGVYGGSPVIWSMINDGDFIHFYYAFTYPEKSKSEYADWAIIGEDIKLSCGIHVGMTAVEAEVLIPELYCFKWENPEYVSNLNWNSNTMPSSWCRQFPQILIAEIDNGNEMPLTIGLFLDEQEIIRAIAFNVPTAG